MKNKKNFVIGFLVILFCIILTVLSIGIVALVKTNSYKQANVIVKDITFEPYSNEGTLKVLVTVEDTENHLIDLTYTDKNGKIITVDAQKNKNKIAVDYEVVQNGEYNFTAHNDKGEIIEKKLVISSNKNEDTLGELIKVNQDVIIDSGKTLGTKENVEINYFYDLGTTMYKIGNQDKWTNYEGQFTVDSYFIINNNLANEDGTVSIFAKSEDAASNKIIVSEQVLNMDLDIPESPKIKIVSAPKYGLLTSNGAVMPVTFEGEFDSRTDIINYYSLDKGTTWQEYTGQIQGNANFYVYLKSVKNISGLEIQTNLSLEPSESDAIKSVAYDGEYGYYNGFESYNGTYDYWGDSTLRPTQSRYVDVDASSNDRELKIWYTKHELTKMAVIIYDENNNEISKIELDAATRLQTTQTIPLPANARRIAIDMNIWFASGSITSNAVYELKILDKN